LLKETHGQKLLQQLREEYKKGKLRQVPATQRGLPPARATVSERQIQPSKSKQS
jgi:hypothetical protein